MNPLTSIAIAQIIFYIPILLLFSYILLQHGRHGILGYLYLIIFCVLRITGAILLLVAGSGNFTANLLGSIGLSPLLLGILGVLHEGRYYRLPALNRKPEWIFIILFHILISSGLGVLASGASALQNGGDTGGTNGLLIKVGVCCMDLGWVILVCWGTASLFQIGKKDGKGDRWKCGTTLLNASILTLPFLLLRVLSTTIAVFHPTAELSLSRSTIGLKVGLITFPELMVMVILVVAGIWTRNIKREGDREVMLESDEGVRMVGVERVGNDRKKVWV